MEATSVVTRGPESGKQVPEHLLSAGVVKRFWEKVQYPENRTRDCWEWTGAKSVGYGQFSIGGKLYQAHRIAYVIEYGQVPAGMVVGHRCDNRGCLNPRHLEAITQGQNTLDAIERNLMGGLGMHSARQLRADYPRLNVQQLCMKYGVHESNVRAVLRNASYRDESYSPAEYITNCKLARVGEKNPGAKLTSADVLWARTEFAAGRLRGRDIMRVLGIAQPTCSQMLSGKTWRNVPLVDELKKMAA